MIVSVFVRRLKEGRTFADFLAEWEADRGFGVPTRVFNAQSLEDPRDVISIGFVAVTAEEAAQIAVRPPESEQVRHERIDTVIESTELRCMYDLRGEHDFTADPLVVALGGEQSLLAPLVAARARLDAEAGA